VELRFFGGLTAEETAEVLGISLRTVHREWDLARAWLFRELRGTGTKSGQQRSETSE
jgi:DNA-directed RNA polymerase specialized sigma24 family protein